MKEVQQRRAVDGNALASIPLGLSVQRDGICTFRDDDVGQEARAIAGLVVDFGGSIGGEDGFTAAATKFLLDMELPLKTSRN